MSIHDDPVAKENHNKAMKKFRKRTPQGDEKNPMTPEKWKILLQWIANGGTRAEAAVAASVSRQTIQAYLISEPTAMGEYRAAERAWVRRDWPIERIDEFLTLVAMGRTNKDAGEEMEFMDGELDQLMKVILHDPSIKELYDEARKLQCEAWGDDMVQIADDATGDFYIDHARDGTPVAKADGDHVNRAKLKIGTRQWLMARIHHERFGDRIQQDIKGELNVNHADQLDMARKRKEQAKTMKEQMVAKAVELPPDSAVH